MDIRENTNKSTSLLAQWVSRHSSTPFAAHSPTTQQGQEELLVRNKVEWEKQQHVAAAAAMCYWGYSEQNHFLLGGKEDWKAADKKANLRNIQSFTTFYGTSKKKQNIQPLVSEENQGTSKPFPCDDCGKSFRQHSQLSTHQRIHTGDRPYLCNECPKAFRTQGTLAIHKRIHTGEKPYCCEECGRSFRTQGTLVIHRRTHTGDRPYKCQDCGKAFAARCSLVVHWRIHTGEKPYMCTECGKVFASRSDSARHTRTHQAGSSGKTTLIKHLIQGHPSL